MSLLSGLATGIGALIVLWFGEPTRKVLGFYLGLASGIMGIVVLADLLPSSIIYGNLFYTLTGLLIGIIFMFVFDWILAKILFSRKQFGQGRTQSKFYQQMGYFMTLAIALHNLPEGLAIGAGYETQSQLGIRVALVIALHNIPEGLGIASTLLLGKIPSIYVFLLSIATGLFIPLGTLVALGLGQIVPYWISIGLSIASGAMGYIVVKDIGPESIKLHPLLSRFGMGLGILIMYIVYNLHH
ncbi:ZIP family metal transporter [Tepidibacillus fermentans]|uniref:ZIP family zinc transporter n=1 Tax=Tepidibacillus fermentans TaxID=1281767 RepID=A0A4R3K5N9_9BACI|nr:ZIP family metal transporter [Tepidibacillus fermentans]TCS78037.1 ZIP family zinc transporter [Tepidibacillus fermentans]